MKIITKTTLYTSAIASVPPGTEVELDDAEAQSLVERGLAEWPLEPVPAQAAAKDQADAEPKAAAIAEADALLAELTQAAAKDQADAEAKAAAIAEADALLAELTQAAEEAFAKAAAETDAKAKKALEAEATKAKAAADEAQAKLDQAKA